MFIVFVLRHRIIIKHFIKVYVKYTLADEITKYVFTSGITILILKKGDIEFVTEFPCLLGHPGVSQNTWEFSDEFDVAFFKD